MFYRILVFNANSVDPDQMLCSAASDLGLHCLPMSLLWDDRHKWVNEISYLFQFCVCLVNIMLNCFYKFHL